MTNFLQIIDMKNLRSDQSDNHSFTNLVSQDSLTPKVTDD